MRIQNTSRIPTTKLRPVLTQVINSAPLGKARTWLQGKDGLYVVVQNAKRSRVAGRIYPDAIEIHRKGKPIAVRGYIKLYVFPYKILDDIAKTFAHELSHFKDWYDYAFIKDYGNVPYGREKRARAFADKAMRTLASTEEMRRCTKKR